MFDQSHAPRKRIAVVGGGISGMAAAYYLSADHDVTLFEAEARLGGHARTVMAGINGDQPVDTGFIVFNYATYPYLTRLFRDLEVPVAKSDMSFGASIDGGRIEYGLTSLGSFAAQKRNLANPRYYGMVADIVKFGKHAEDMATADMSIGDLVATLGLGDWFRNYYLLPMAGAIWSTPVENIDQFPARSLVRFFRNHALLAGSGKHQWWTVQGGSIEYVRRLQAALAARGCDIRTGTPVTGLQRGPDHVKIRAGEVIWPDFDEVILASHSDQALAILGEAATPAERAALGAIRYQPNTAVLHRDPGQMPRRRACWASWSYRSQNDRIGVTYWMNRLQNIPDHDPHFVTLNPTTDIPEEAIYDQVEFAHPVFDAAALRAQDQIRSLQGANRTWFAGAYNRHGFHEDGIASAMRIIRQINARPHLKGPANADRIQSIENAVSVDMRATA